MSPLANLLSRGKEEDASLDVSDLPAPRLTVVAKVNLLPPEIGEAERFRREQVVRLAAVVATIAVVGVAVVAANGQVGQAQESVDVATAKSTALEAEVATYADVPRTAAELRTAQAQRAGALGQEVRWSQYLNGLGLVTGKLPTQVQSLAIVQAVDATGTTPPTSYTGKAGIATVTYTGMAKNNDAVAAFLDALAKQKGNIDPAFTSAVASSDPSSKKDVVNFGATVTVTSEAQSGRYTKTGG